MDPSSSRTRENILMKRARRYSSRDREKGTIFRLRREKKAGRATGEPRKKAHFDRCNGRIHVNGSGEHPLFSSNVSLIVHQPFRSPTFSLSLFLYPELQKERHSSIITWPSLFLLAIISPSVVFCSKHEEKRRESRRKQRWGIDGSLDPFH